MYYTVYETTNQINGMTYIGAHRTPDPYDSYLGSGKLLRRAIKFYGKKAFKKEILFLEHDEISMFIRESTIVTEDYVKMENTYNLRVGGRHAYIRNFVNNGKDNVGFVVCKDECNNTVRVTSEKFRNSADLDFIFAGTALVKDPITGRNFRIPIDDPEFHKYSGHTKGKTYAIRKEDGVGLYLDTSDPRWKSGEVVGNQYGKKYYNDGASNYFLSPDDQRCGTLRVGQLKRERKNLRWYHDSTGSYMCEDGDPRIKILSPGRKPPAQLQARRVCN